MSPNLVSVIVLNLNGEKIIGKCLDHLLAQTYGEFEIVVVDNGSSDGSLVVLQEYLASGRVSVLRNERNLGVPGGRNQGVLYARGEIVAFMDNDGYADPNWLKEAVRTLESDSSIGAVASVVFFNKRKIILNGAGGTLNFQGYGGDVCFNMPYEFAELPREVLYPMGCGMVVRKSIIEKIGPLDSHLFNYYDDAELGIRVWKAGFQVVVSPYAWVDHDFSYSDRLLHNKVYLCERNRLRTVLKYYPARRLVSWVVREWYFLRYFRYGALCSIPLKAWTWNLVHLPSALKWRAKFAFGKHSFWPLLDPSWGTFPPPIPDNQGFRPDPGRATHSLILNGGSDRHQLNFGWYHLERDGPIAFRWTDRQASAFIRFSSPVHVLSMRVRPTWSGRHCRVILRRLGAIDPELDVQVEFPSSAWQDKTYPITLGSGVYECLLLSEPAFVDGARRRLGLAVAWLHFD